MRLMSCLMIIKRKMCEEKIFQLQSMFKVIRCVDQSLKFCSQKFQCMLSDQADQNFQKKVGSVQDISNTQAPQWKMESQIKGKQSSAFCATE